MRTGRVPVLLFAQAEEIAQKVRFVIPSEARDLLFFSACKKQQIPRAKPALRNDRVPVFPQPVKPAATRAEIRTGVV
jgi:hypothetical protein